MIEIATIRKSCIDKTASCGGLAILVGHALRHANPDVRAAAATALGGLHSDAGMNTLLTVARFDPAPSVRTVAIRALGAFVANKQVAKALKDLRDNDADPAIRSTAADTLLLGGSPGEKSAKSEWERHPDPSLIRTIYTPTAFNLPKYRWNATGYDIGHWSLAVGLTDWLEATMQASVPVMVIHLGPGLKFCHSFSDKIHLGVWVNAQFLIPYLDDIDDSRVILFGGSPILTLGTPDLNLNISLLMYGIWAKAESQALYLIDPNIGGSVRVHRMVKLNLELHVPLLGTSDDGVWDMAGKLWGILYGIRIFGDKIYGDIAFLMPVFDDLGGEVEWWDLMQFTPMGWPLLAFGFSW